VGKHARVDDKKRGRHKKHIIRRKKDEMTRSVQDLSGPRADASFITEIKSSILTVKRGVRIVSSRKYTIFRLMI
jgi:hypothetical protein